MNPIDIMFRTDGRVELELDQIVIVLNKENTEALINSCLVEQAKRVVDNRLHALIDCDKEYPCFSMPVHKILSNEPLRVKMAEGLVSGWKADLDYDEHVDDQIEYTVMEHAKETEEM